MVECLAVKVGGEMTKKTVKPKLIVCAHCKRYIGYRCVVTQSSKLPLHPRICGSFRKSKVTHSVDMHGDDKLKYKWGLPYRGRVGEI